MSAFHPIRPRPTAAIWNCSVAYVDEAIWSWYLEPASLEATFDLPLGALYGCSICGSSTVVSLSI
jgi:hypothetical protein